MHKLNRAHVIAPVCLDNYTLGKQRWDDVTSQDKEQVHTSLNTMQGKRCAYCECKIEGSKAHLEHFFPKYRYPKKAFDWSNLFLSCNTKKTCGTRKDSSITGDYDPVALVKPDVDEPDDYLHFLPNGKVIARSGLCSSRHWRAEETIRVFNLNDPKLEAKRRRMVSQFNDSDPNLLEELEEFELGLRLEWIRHEIDATSGNPHCTVIRHFLAGLAQVGTKRGG